MENRESYAQIIAVKRVVRVPDLSQEAWHQTDVYPAREPTQNAYKERFNRTVRHEWLDEHLFESIDHAQQTATG